MRCEDLQAYSMKQKKKVNFDLNQEHVIEKLKNGAFMAKGYDDMGNKICVIVPKSEIEEM